MGVAACLDATDLYSVVRTAATPEDYLAAHDPGTRLVVMVHPLLVNGGCGIAFLHAHLPHLRILAYSPQATAAGMQSAVRSGASGYLPMNAGIRVLQCAVDDVRIKGQYFHEPFVAEALRSVADGVPARTALKPGLLELLRLLADLDQYTDQQIAAKTGLPLNTVLDHKKKLYAHFKVNTKTAAVLIGIIDGHIPLPERKAK